MPDTPTSLKTSPRTPAQSPLPALSPPAPRFPGGEYEIDGVLGAGGMAVVYKARDMRRPRVVAIKILRPEIAHLIGTDRFLREIAVTAAFSHPHILPLLDSGELTDDRGRVTPYYVMPLVDGETLHQRMVREGQMPLSEVLRIIREILEALQYAHAKGVIHRDIKPANILLSGGHAVVADFGVARPLPIIDSEGISEQVLTMPGDIVGTPTYMAPEQALGKGVVDARADLFSVGCVLYEMLVGIRPFDTPIPQYTQTRKQHGMFVQPSTLRKDMPEALEELLATALKANPAERFQSAAAFLHSLAKVDERSAVGRGLTVTGDPWPSWMRTAAIAAVAVIGVVAAATYSSRKGNSKAQLAAPLTTDKSRVAVLPLELRSPDSLLAVVASGIQTDLIDELAQFPALTVISKNGVMQFRGNAASTDSIARVLNVGSVVTGDIRRFGDSVRVTVRLVDGSTGVQRSSADASGSIHDVLAVRSSVIDSVTSFLRRTIGREIGASERQDVSVAEAWELHARAKSFNEELGLSPSRARFHFIDSMLMKAATLDSRWPAPLITSGLMLLQEANFEDQSSPRSGSARESQLLTGEQLRRRAVIRANDALVRSPGNAYALYLRGRARLELWRTASPVAPDSLRAAAEEDLRSAVSRRGDMADAWNDLSVLLQMTGEYAGSREAAGAALKSDAFLKSAPAVVARLLFTSLATGDFEKARSWCAQGRRQYPARPQFWGCELTILGWTGNSSADVAAGWQLLHNAEARDTLGQLASGWATRRLLIAAIAARAKMGDSARAIVRMVSVTPPVGATAGSAEYGEAYVHTLLGHPEQAIPLLQRYVAVNPALRGQVRKSPWFATLRTNPAFLALTATQ